MAAAAVSSAKRSLRAELKRRLRALSAEERLRQSRLLAQKVGERYNSHRSCRTRQPPGLRICAGASLRRAHVRPARARPLRARSVPLSARKSCCGCWNAVGLSVRAVESYGVCEGEDGSG